MPLSANAGRRQAGGELENEIRPQKLPYLVLLGRFIWSS
jgi:hypothetical protein